MRWIIYIIGVIRHVGIVKSESAVSSTNIGSTFERELEQHSRDFAVFFTYIFRLQLTDLGFDMIPRDQMSAEYIINIIRHVGIVKSENGVSPTNIISTF